MAFAAVLSSASPATTTSHRHASPLHSRRRSSFKTLALPPLPATVADLSLDSPAAAIAVLGGGSIAALAAALSLSDPERRRQQQASEVGGDDKEVVREYFNTTGFDRWRKIYSDATEGVNKVQLDIRLGHSKTVDNTIAMLKDDGPLAGVTICDAGCGTGSLSIPLAREGAVVTATDISAAMVDEARRRALEELSEAQIPKFDVSDLEGLQGKWDTVVCLDVLIHYPQDKADGMIAHLASLAERRLLLSFAPKTFYYDLLKRIGELFPGPSKATRAYLHAERDVERALRKVGWKINKKGLISTQFYFSKLIEAIPA
ncbi:hypothetical protein J5N97_029210 [Dioscorea zingiberensis]|uniref:Magnesium-protoporphyrin IX methyltransferase C-terminal domain-containing protein n=1 Tax=Dioscorea zingiberensis TaxID=325984 RepID=A0A9D5C0V2_9LILI|nr:hypothetical protein J5N97_029210 [Dioscorea zingiberensis]